VTDDRRQRVILTRHFLRGFLDNDLVSPANDLHGVLARLAALLVIPAVFFPFELLFKYTYPFRTYEQLEAASWSDKSVFVTLSFIVMGLLTVLQWDALQLDRRDAMALGVLPIRSRTVIQAKMAALGTFLLAAAGVPAVIGAASFPLIMHARWPTRVVDYGATVLGHLAASMGVAAFVFFTLLGVHGVLRIVLGPAAFRRASAAVQMGVTFALAVALLMLPTIAAGTASLKAPSSAAGRMAPQMWFLGVYEAISGQADPDWRRLATRGVVALVASLVLGVTANLLAYRRVSSRAIDAVQAGRPGRSVMMRVFDGIGGVLARDPAERGFFAFTLVTLGRSAWHRVLMAGFLGGALALSIAAIDVTTYDVNSGGRHPVEEPHLLFIELLVVAMAMIGVRTSAASPAELRANWMLRTVDLGRGASWMAGFRKAVMTAVAVPLSLVLAAAVGLVAGWDVAWPHAIVMVVFAALMFEVLFLGFDKVPFACAFAGASGTFKVRWLALGALLTTVLFPVAQLIVAARTSPANVAVLAAVAAIGIAALRVHSRRAMARGDGLRFEPQEDRTQALGLSD